MTIKLLKISIISTLLTYITLIIVASDIGIIQYQNIKSNNNEEIFKNIQLEQEINELQGEIDQLNNQNQVLDLAFELGYVNAGDEIYNIETNYEKNTYNSENITIKNNIYTNKKYFNNWKNYQFFLLSIPIGIAISICYLLISKKMERKHAK